MTNGSLMKVKVLITNFWSFWERPFYAGIYTCVCDTTVATNTAYAYSSAWFIRNWWVFFRIASVMKQMLSSEIKKLVKERVERETADLKTVISSLQVENLKLLGNVSKMEVTITTKVDDLQQYSRRSMFTHGWHWKEPKWRYQLIGPGTRWPIKYRCPTWGYWSQPPSLSTAKKTEC